MSNKDAYWNKTKNHMIVTLVIWAFFSLVIFMFGSELNTMSFLGYPLAYYMTAQGSLLAFVVMLFWTANKQEKIDEEHGFSERGGLMDFKGGFIKNLPKYMVSTQEVSQYSF